jgi:hypothetical protein
MMQTLYSICVQYYMPMHSACQVGHLSSSGNNLGVWRCRLQVTCSRGGSCVLADNQTDSTTAAAATGAADDDSDGGSSSSSSNNTAPAAPPPPAARPASPSAAAAVRPPLTRARPVNKAPVIRLVDTPELGEVVKLKQGSSYGVCAAGVQPTAANPCELGAQAEDPDGGTDGSALNMTDKVVVCPPAECLTLGCSGTTLRAHLFSVKGLAGCGIDTSAPLGTRYSVDFWVWDAGTPSRNASVSRSIVLVDPCTDSASPYTCTDTSTGQLYCSGVSCDQAPKYRPPAPSKLQLVLLPRAGPMYLQYQRPAPFSLGPCQSLTRNSSCGAVAYQHAGASGLLDLTADIQVQDVTPCAADQVGGRGGMGVPCHMTTGCLSQAGWLMHGQCVLLLHQLILPSASVAQTLPEHAMQMPGGAV